MPQLPRGWLDARQFRIPGKVRYRKRKEKKIFNFVFFRQVLLLPTLKAWPRSTGLQQMRVQGEGQLRHLRWPRPDPLLHPAVHHLEDQHRRTHHWAPRPTLWPRQRCLGTSCLWGRSLARQDYRGFWWNLRDQRSLYQSRVQSSQLLLWS